MGIPIYADYALDTFKGPVVGFIIETVVAIGLANLAVMGLKKLNLYNGVWRTAIGGVTLIVILGLLAHAMHER